MITKEANMKHQYKAALSLALMLALVLCGCAAKIELSSGTVKDSIQSITAVVTPEDLEKLDGFEKLISADFSGSTCYDALLSWAEEHPLVETTYTVTFPGDIVVDNHATELDLTGLRDVQAYEAMDLLGYLPRLKSVNLGSESDGLSPENALLFSDAYLGIDFTYHCQLLGKDSQLKEQKLDLTGTSPKEIRAALKTISCLRDLEKIQLGSDEREDAPSWHDILALREAAPNAKIYYNFTLYDMPFTLEDRSMDLSYHQITDEGTEVLEIAKCMRNLETLNMDSCGVSNESMAMIRDELPNTDVIWRINFGMKYTALTNTERILASSPSVGGRALTNSDVSLFKYFTKVKYLDIGHNESITDLSFVHFMPDLEVLIIAMNPLGDLRPLAECENLEYLELFYSNTDDLTPLAGLKNLRHLNVGHCPLLTDISPIYDLDLDRFYLGVYQFCPVPPEQVEHYRILHPDCEVDNEQWESSEGAWRLGAFLEGEELEWYMQQPYYREDRRNYAPRYALLRDQMGYDGLLYSTKWNDPTYRSVSWFQ